MTTESNDGGGGGAGLDLADLLHGGGEPPAGTPPVAGDPPAGDPPKADPPAGDPPAGDPAPKADPASGDPKWFDSLGLSKDRPDRDTLSDAEWLANKGYQDPATLIKAMRGLESKVGKALTPPGEDATPEERDAFFKAIGRPDDVAGYAMPEIPEGTELDGGLFEAAAKAAFGLGAPKGVMDGIAAAVIQYQADVLEQEATAETAAAHAKLAEWDKAGTKAENLALSQRAARALEGIGWDRQTTHRIQAAVGSAKWLDALTLLGGQMAEDNLSSPGAGRKSFDVSAADAQRELDTIDRDPATGEAMMKGGEVWAPIKAKRERLMAVIAADKEAQRAAR